MHELCWAQRDSHDTGDTLSFSSSSSVAAVARPDPADSGAAAAGAGPGAPHAIGLVIGPAASLQGLIISSFTPLQPSPLFLANLGGWHFIIHAVQEVITSFGFIP